MALSARSAGQSVRPDQTGSGSDIRGHYARSSVAGFVARLSLGAIQNLSLGQLRHARGGAFCSAKSSCLSASSRKLEQTFRGLAGPFDISGSLGQSKCGFLTRRKHHLRIEWSNRIEECRGRHRVRRSPPAAPPLRATSCDRRARSGQLRRASAIASSFSVGPPVEIADR